MSADPLSADPVYVDQLAAVRAFYADRGADSDADADLAAHVLEEWSELLGCAARDVITVLRIADLARFCVVRGLDPPLSPEDYDTEDDLRLLATAVGQQQLLGRVQPVLRMAGLAALDRLELVAGMDDRRRTELAEMRAGLMSG